MSKRLMHLLFARMALVVTTVLLLTADVLPAEADTTNVTSGADVTNLTVVGTLNASNIVSSSNLFGGGSGYGVFFVNGSHVGETPGGSLSLSTYQNLFLVGRLGIQFRSDTFSLYTNFANCEIVSNDLTAGGSVGAHNILVNNGQIIFTNTPSATPQGIVTTNTPTNSFFNGALGPIQIPSSSEAMILTNAWAYLPGAGTNQQVFITLTSPLVTFSAGTFFGASQAPVTIVITNFGGGSSGGIIVTSNPVPSVAQSIGAKSGGAIEPGSTFPGAAEGIGSNLGLRTGTTGYSLYYTNKVSGVGRFASLVTIVSQ